MTSLTIIAIALAAVATGLIIASVILAGRQSTERRPGFITDQLGASPARAHTPAPWPAGQTFGEARRAEVSDARLLAVARATLEPDKDDAA